MPNRRPPAPMTTSLITYIVVNAAPTSTTNITGFFATILGFSDGGNWRNLSDTVVTYTPNSKLSLMANGDYGRVQGLTPLAAAACGAACKGAVDWSGVAGYARYQFTPLWALAGRYE